VSYFDPPFWASQINCGLAILGFTAFDCAVLGLAVTGLNMLRLSCSFASAILVAEHGETRPFVRFAIVGLAIHYAGRLSGLHQESGFAEFVVLPSAWHHRESGVAKRAALPRGGVDN